MTQSGSASSKLRGAGHLASVETGKGDLPVFTSAALDQENLAPAQINPDWVVEGNPQASCETLAEGTRGWAYANHWACTAGSFHWQYTWDETVLFLEGEVTITDENGKTYHGKPGTSLFFPAGTAALWHVPVYIRKLAFNHKPVPWYAHKAVRIVERLQRLVGKVTTNGHGLGG